MDLAELIAEFPIKVTRGEAAGCRVSDLTDDSRTAVPGSLFVARRGHAFDGRQYVAAALECGAVAVLTDDPALELPERGRVVVLLAEDVPGVTARLADRFYGEPSCQLTLVGITGTNGKTTVAHLVHRVINALGVRCGLIGTVEIDDGRERAPAVLTTPGAIELSRTLATMVESGCRACVMEVSSHALDQRRADGLQLDVGVFTNLSGDHLDYHGDEETYANAKKRLFELLDEDGLSLVNADDPRGIWIAGPNPTACSLTDPAAPWFARVESTSIDGMQLQIDGSGDAADLRIAGRVPLVGAHNAMNTLQAIAAADAVLRHEGWDDAERAAGLTEVLSDLRAPPGRLERVSEPGQHVGPAVFVDYAHTDDALVNTLRSVRPLVPAGGKLWVVFGCGGDRDASKRPRMGAAAAEHADHLVVTSDNPRTESPKAIIEAVVAGIPPKHRFGVRVEIDREPAIRAAIFAAGPDDVIVIAGKGHEPYQLLPDGMGGVVRRSFDDREVARIALREARLRAGATP